MVVETVDKTIINSDHKMPLLRFTRIRDNKVTEIIFPLNTNTFIFIVVFA